MLVCNCLQSDLKTQSFVSKFTEIHLTKPYNENHVDMDTAKR